MDIYFNWIRLYEKIQNWTKCNNFIGVREYQQSVFAIVNSHTHLDHK